MVDITETLYTAVGTQGLFRMLKWWPPVDLSPFNTKVNLGSTMKLDLRWVVQDHWSSGLDLSPLNPNFYLALSSVDQYFFLFVFFSVYTFHDHLAILWSKEAWQNVGRSRASSFRHI